MGINSIVLIVVVCDAQYRFTVVDIGEAGRHSDGGVLANLKFDQALENGTLSILVLLQEPLNLSCHMALL